MVIALSETPFGRCYWLIVVGACELGDFETAAAPIEEVAPVITHDARPASLSPGFSVAYQ